MTLDQIVEAGVKSKSARDKYERFTKDPDGYNPISADIIAQGYDENNPQDRADMESAQTTGRDTRKDYILGVVAEQAENLIDLVKGKHKEVIEGIRPAIDSYLIGNKPVEYSGVDAEFFKLYSAAVSANETIEALKSGNPALRQKAIEDYITQVKSDSEKTGRTKTRIEWTEIAVKLRPDMAINSLFQSSNRIVGEFGEFVRNNGDKAVIYLNGLFDSLKDKEQDK